MEKLLKIFATLRRILEPLTWSLFQPKRWRNLPDLEKWDELKDLSPSEFSEALNKYEYKYDKIQGLLDNVQPVNEPQYFFKDLTTDRDCDNWARQWVIYYRYHKCPCQEWIVTNRKHLFTKSHLIAVVNEGDGWRLLNYDRYPNTHKNIEEAISDINSWPSYSDDERIQCLYRDWPVVADSDSQGYADIDMAMKS